MGQPPQQPGWGQHSGSQPSGEDPYGQPPPPPYGYQQPPPGKSGGGNTAGVILAIVAALVLLGGGGTLVAYLAGAFDGSGGGPGGSARSPEQTVEQFWAATQDGDCGTAIELVTEKIWSDGGKLTQEESLADCEESFAEEGDVQVEDTTLVSEAGDTAVVEATMTIPDLGPSTIRHDLVREDGEWKIDVVDFGL